jgi:hypothetical protein
MPTHDQLPIPDFDHLPAGSLAHRIRSLPADELRDLLDYERGHADRLPVVELLTSRLAALENGAEPSGGDSRATQPENPGAPDGGSTANPAQEAPTNQPLRHGQAAQTPNRPIRGR